MNFLTKKPIIALAPMAGMTSESFRKSLLLIESRPDLFFTEFVPVESIRKAGEKTLDALYYSSGEHPIIAQFYGRNQNDFYLAAFVAAHLGFDGIDLNLGCSVKKVFSKGGGAGLINQNNQVRKIVFSIQKAIDDYGKGKDLSGFRLRKEVRQKIEDILAYGQNKLSRERKITFSIKTRLGIKKPETEEWISFLASLRPDFISLHGRTVNQSFGGRADWEEIRKAGEIARTKKVPLLGNGDIDSLEQAKERIEDCGLAGVLIGRRAMANPWMFSGIKPKAEDVLKLIQVEAEIFSQDFSWRNFKELRSHFSAYCRGFDGAKELRMKLIRVNSFEDTKNVIDESYKTLQKPRALIG